MPVLGSDIGYRMPRVLRGTRCAGMEGMKALQERLSLRQLKERKGKARQRFQRPDAVSGEASSIIIL